jgi:PRTRC genetic system protein A
MSHDLDARDAAIFSTLPMALSPVHGHLADVSMGNKRLISARDGVYLEVRSPAMHLCLRLSALDIELPYGDVTPFVRLAGGPVPKALLREAIEHGVRACPNETALAVVFDPQQKTYTLADLPILEATTGAVRYTDTLDDDLLVFDFHSHGHYPGQFSAADNDSDRSRRGPYIAWVAGDCADAGQVTLSARVCCSPFLIPLSILELQSQGVIE